jgi:predicted Zn-dependent protease
VAHQLRRPESLLTAATRAYELEPGSVVCANNYAAALLVNRRQPDEAIKLTLQIMDWFPNSNGAKINHALALLLNRRVGEAAALLGAIHREKLNAIERTSLNLGWFEASLAQQQYDKAREASDGIDVNMLYPNQRKWLEEARRQLPARTAAP